MASDSRTASQTATSSIAASIDFDRLLKLRLVVARVGEMDLARWWNTNGQLGAIGAASVSRGFPRTHYFAQARSVFAVAKQRCNEIFEIPGSVTLWNLPVSLEDEFDAQWEHWLDHADEWEEFFSALAALSGTELMSEMDARGLIDADTQGLVGKLRRSSEGRAVKIDGVFDGSSSDISLLAAAFSLGEPGAVAVPYMETVAA